MAIGLSETPQPRQATPAKPLLLDVRARVGEKVHQGIFWERRDRMSGLIASAKPYRIKAAHRRRRKVAVGLFVQRYYDPTLGRFLSVDPVTANGNTGGNFNRYWYANNNPYKFTDPDGRQVFCNGSRICPGGGGGGGGSGGYAFQAGGTGQVRKSAKVASQEINRFISDNPNKTIPLSAKNMGALADLTMLDLRNNQEDNGSFKNMSAMNFLSLIKGDAGDSIFISWASQSFDVQGMSAPYGGRHLGSDINYMMQGMSWAAKGESRFMMSSAVAAWNFGQGISGDGIRNFNQIPHAQMWGNFGYSYYLQQARE